MSAIEADVVDGVKAEAPIDVPSGALFLKIPASTLWMHIRNGKVLTIRIGKHVRIPAAELRRIAREGL